MVSCSRWTIASISASSVRADCAIYPKSFSNSWCFDIFLAWADAELYAALLLLYSQQPAQTMALWVTLRVRKQQHYPEIGQRLQLSAFSPCTSLPVAPLLPRRSAPL